MNWKEVKEKYKKSITLLNDWDFAKTECKRPFYTRDLYDFFDEQGIRVFIDYGISQTEKGKLIYYANIIDGEELNFVPSLKHYPTRTEAEEQAFLRAFQLLEDKLKEGR